MKIITWKWIGGWLELALLIIVSSLALAAPFVPLVWLLWNWLVPHLFGGPHLSLVEAAGLTLLAKWLQPAAMLTNHKAVPPTA